MNSSESQFFLFSLFKRRSAEYRASVTTSSAKGSRECATQSPTKFYVELESADSIVPTNTLLPANFAALDIVPSKSATLPARQSPSKPIDIRPSTKRNISYQEHHFTREDRQKTEEGVELRPRAASSATHQRRTRPRCQCCTSEIGEAEEGQRCESGFFSCGSSTASSISFSSPMRSPPMMSLTALRSAAASKLNVVAQQQNQQPPEMEAIQPSADTRDASATTIVSTPPPTRPLSGETVSASSSSSLTDVLVTNPSSQNSNGYSTLPSRCRSKSFLFPSTSASSGNNVTVGTQRSFTKEHRSLSASLKTLLRVGGGSGATTMTDCHTGKDQKYSTNSSSPFIYYPESFHHFQNSNSNNIATINKNGLLRRRMSILSSSAIAVSTSASTDSGVTRLYQRCNSSNTSSGHQLPLTCSPFFSASSGGGAGAAVLCRRQRQQQRRFDCHNRVCDQSSLISYSLPSDASTFFGRRFDDNNEYEDNDVNIELAKNRRCGMVLTEEEVPEDELHAEGNTQAYLLSLLAAPSRRIIIHDPISRRQLVFQKSSVVTTSGQ